LMVTVLPFGGSKHGISNSRITRCFSDCLHVSPRSRES
jgi:hypothetical protein